MTDAPDLTPEQDAVRRLLAEVRHDQATPPEVVARLDDTLASLVAERGDASVPDTRASAASSPVTDAPVVDLGARRRRLAGVGLLAAAAVVVAGVAIGQGLPGMSGGEDAGSAAGGDTATSESREPGDANGDSSDSGSGAAEMGPQSLKSTAPAPDAGYPTLSSVDAGLGEELLDLRVTDSTRAAEQGAGESLSGCDLQGVGPGRRVGAEVDGQPGVVVFRRPAGDAQDVAIYVCGTPEPVRTLTLPAP